MKIDFWTNANMGLFWEYVKTLLVTIQPGVMLWVAVGAVGLLLGIVVNAWRESSEKKKEDDVEYREY